MIIKQHKNLDVEISFSWRDVLTILLKRKIVFAKNNFLHFGNALISTLVKMQFAINESEKKDSKIE